MANDANFEVDILASDMSAETKYFFPDSATVRDFCEKVDAVRELSNLGVAPESWAYYPDKDNQIIVTLRGPDDVENKDFDISELVKILNTLFVKEK